MIKWLIFIGAAVLLWKLISGDKRKKEMTKVQKDEKMAASGQMVKDPICGSYVNKESDIRVKAGEQVYSFCSFECRDKFIKRLESSDTDTDKS